VSKLIEDTAYHEAGHAVMAFIVRKKFRHVTIQSGEDQEGAILIKRPKVGHRQKHTDAELHAIANHLERHILILVAGYIASGLFYIKTDAEFQTIERTRAIHAGIESDYQIAHQYASRILRSRMTRKLSAGRTSREIINALEARADTILSRPEVWLGVQALADALLLKTTLRYREARQVFARAAEGGAAK
jgi:hypothetical protein